MQFTDCGSTPSGNGKLSGCRDSLVVQLPADTPSMTSRQGESASKSVWFQRFKLRDEAEKAKKKAAEVDVERRCLDVPAAQSESLYPSDQASKRKGVEEGRASIKEGVASAFQQDKALTKPDFLCGDTAKCIFEESTVPDSSRSILNKQKDLTGGLQNQGFTEAKEVGARSVTGGASAVPPKSGFGPWIKAKAGIRLEEKPQLEPERTAQHALHGSGTGKFSSSSQRCKQAREKEQDVAGGASRLNISVWRSGSGGEPQTEEVAHARLGKPPLPPPRPGTPSRVRPRFASKPTTLKTHSHPFLPGRLWHSPCVQGIPVSDRLDVDSQLVRSPLQKSIIREGMPTRKIVDGDEARSTKLIDGTFARGCRALEGSRPSNQLDCAHAKDLAVDCSQDLAVNSVEAGLLRSLPSASQTANNGGNSPHVVSFGKVVPAIEFSQSRLCNQFASKRSTMAHPRPNFPRSKQEPSEGSGAFAAKGDTFLHNATPATGAETSELPSAPAPIDSPSELPVVSIVEVKMSKGGEVMRSAVGELNGSSSQPLPLPKSGSYAGLETSHGAVKLDEADRKLSESVPGNSSTASYPWGLFIGAAGTSRKAREQFVEVYNRARDDLKNQRTSQIMGRVPDKEMEDTPRLAAEQLAEVCALSSCGFEGKSHCQESLEAVNGKVEPVFKHADGKASNLSVQESEQPHSGLQVCRIEGNLWRSQDKESQAFQSLYGADGGVGPKVETSQHGNSPVAPAVVFALNTFSSGQGETGQGETIIPPKHSERLEEGELQFGVQNKTAKERVFRQDQDCQRMLEQRLDVEHVASQVPWQEGTTQFWDQGFLRKAEFLVNSQKVDQRLEASRLSKGLVQLTRVSNDRGDKNQVSLLLGKRPRGVFPEVAIPGIHTGVTGKVSIDGTERPRTEIQSNKPHKWLQRWQSTPHFGEGWQGHTHVHGQVNKAGQQTCGNFALGSFKNTDTNSNKLIGQATEFKSFAQPVVKEQEVKYFQVGSAKILPSPAAMAIVGTATRQYCSAQLERKGCLSFW